MMRASVVFPDPGGPQKMQDATSPRRIKSPSGLPGPSSCSWPRNSSRVFGRIRAASGSFVPCPPCPWKRVGSDTGDGKREAGNGKRGVQKGRQAQKMGTHAWPRHPYLPRVRQLQSLDAWRAAHELAELAYRLTTDPSLTRHF